MRRGERAMALDGLDVVGLKIRVEAGVVLCIRIGKG